MKIHFISFGTSWNYSNSIKRIKQQSSNMNIFDTINIYTEKDIDNEYMNKHKDFFKNNKRGYGYWMWKSYFVKNMMDKIEENDIIIYADSGCTLVNTPNAIKRLNQYITLCSRLEVGNISFQMCFPEKSYSKMDLFKELDVTDEEMFNSGQLVGGIFVLRKCPKTIDLINTYYELSQNYHLINDDKSILSNDVSFVDHRHDQSLFSILRKKMGTIKIPDETWHPNFNDPKVLNFPILATRIRS